MISVKEEQATHMRTRIQCKFNENVVAKNLTHGS